MKIKTRFAPSPTGYLHLGSVRTALYSWLFSRKAGGKFILRIEDTDSERSTQEAIEEIIASMRWLNLDFDEGPYFQTKRFDRYNAVIDKMLLQGTAYKCYCSKVRLDALREKQIINGEKPRYDAYCRDKQYRCPDDPSHVVRFRNPEKGLVIFEDIIRGQIIFNNQELDDLIIRRTDGSPTYNFCVVVDDWDMEISHVIRGEDHISNTPRQINILKSLGAPIPKYAHVSMILGKDGKKLSKRHGIVGVMQYRNDGYLPQTLLNYLVRLGWSHGNQEIFSIDEIQSFFTLDKINKSACTFNSEKLQWLNHYYINHMPAEEVAVYLEWHIINMGIQINNGPQLKDIVKLLRKRCKTLKEMAESCWYFYKDFHNFNATAANKYLQSVAKQPLQTVRDELATISLWTIQNVHDALQDTIDKLGIRMNELGMPLRVAITGCGVSPAIDLTVYTIGKARSVKRIDMALDYIAKKEKSVNDLFTCIGETAPWKNF